MTRITLIALAAFLALPAWSQEPVFLIERVEVRNLHHVSPEIVVDESRLIAGSPYSEAELGSAIDRVRRLPFVLDARVSLEKGSERDHYILVITVDETRPVFYVAEVVPSIENGEEVYHDPPDNRGAVGARAFLGAHSMVHVGLLTRHDDRPNSRTHQVAQVGYTRFGLLSGRAFATISMNRTFPGHGSFVPGFVAGVYLGRDRTLTLTFDEFDTDFGLERNQKIVQLRASRNTTDDPFFPNRGSILSIAPLWLEQREEHLTADERLDLETTGAGVETELGRYWQYGERTTLAAELSAGYFETDTTPADVRFASRDYLYGSMKLRLSYALDRDEKSESRAELTFRSVSDREDFVRNRDGYNEVSIGWARRDAGGSVRLGFGVAW